MNDMKQKGQVIIILLLIMLVALSLGIALTQRSVSDVTTATQAEQATRAYSAAEAGIQKALSSPLPIGSALPLSNNSSVVVNSSGYMPYNGTYAGIEYPPIGREVTAQFWFVDPATALPTAFYTGSSVDVYYGNENTTDLPAVEVKFVVFKNNTFLSKNYYFDSSSSRTTGANDNNFNYTTGCGTQILATGILGSNRTFYCKQNVAITDPTDNTAPYDVCNSSTACIPILARVRFFYINENHSLALAPVGAGVQFPPQVQIYNALGVAGQSQKRIQAYKVRDVIAPWFDFAIFSTNEIRK